jgi:hypothetical protein
MPSSCSAAATLLAVSAAATRTPALTAAIKRLPRRVEREGVELRLTSELTT